MIGIYGVSLGGPGQYWRPVAANRFAMVSRTLPKAADQPVAPVSAAPVIDRNQPSAVRLSGFRYQPGTDPVELSVRSRIQYLSPEELEAEIVNSKSAQEIMAEAECQTCKERKYQDGSDDPGVSFKWRPWRSGGTSRSMLSESRLRPGGRAGRWFPSR